MLAKVAWVVFALIALGSLYEQMFPKRDHGQPPPDDIRISPAETPATSMSVDEMMRTPGSRKLAFVTTFGDVNDEARRKGVDLRLSLEGDDLTVIRFTSRLCASEDQRLFFAGALVAAHLGDEANKAALRKFGFTRLECFDGAGVTLTLDL